MTKSLGKKKPTFACPVCDEQFATAGLRDAHVEEWDMCDRRYRAAKSAPDKPESVLQEADRIINGKRQETYGSPAESHSAIARLWSVFLDVELTAEDVAAMMVLFKMGRYMVGGYNRDTAADMAGYVGIMERIQEGS